MGAFPICGRHLGLVCSPSRKCDVSSPDYWVPLSSLELLRPRDQRVPGVHGEHFQTLPSPAIGLLPIPLYLRQSHLDSRGDVCSESVRFSLFAKGIGGIAAGAHSEVGGVGSRIYRVATNNWG